MAMLLSAIGKPLSAQPGPSEVEQYIMMSDLISVLKNCRAMLSNLGDPDNSSDEKKLFTERMMSDFLQRGGQGLQRFIHRRVKRLRCPRLSGDAGGELSARQGWRTAVLPHHKHTWAVQRRRGICFLFCAWERQLEGVNNAGVRQQGLTVIDVYVRFEYSGDKWSYSPRIYDIRKAEPGVKVRFGGNAYYNTKIKNESDKSHRS
ncbi:MAG: hypothetical protein NZM35_12170 [Chitinophagales bacterium]|nr:hypothetical protein [Chitinophagales bacterium]MDW8420155.1 hypothetical protein [Chitinophagales bacterium]